MKLIRDIFWDVLPEALFVGTGIAFTLIVISKYFMEMPTFWLPFGVGMFYWPILTLVFCKGRAIQ